MRDVINININIKAIAFFNKTTKQENSNKGEQSPAQLANSFKFLNTFCTPFFLRLSSLLVLNSFEVEEKSS